MRYRFHPVIANYRRYFRTNILAHLTTKCTCAETPRYYEEPSITLSRLLYWQLILGSGQRPTLSCDAMTVARGLFLLLKLISGPIVLFDGKSFSERFRLKRFFVVLSLAAKQPRNFIIAKIFLRYFSFQMYTALSLSGSLRDIDIKRAPHDYFIFSSLLFHDQMKCHPYQKFCRRLSAYHTPASHYYRLMGRISAMIRRWHYFGFTCRCHTIVGRF